MGQVLGPNLESSTQEIKMGKTQILDQSKVKKPAI